MPHAAIGCLDSPFSDELLPPSFDDAPEVVDDDDELVEMDQAVESERLLLRAETALDELDEADAMSMLRAALRLDPTNDRAASLLEALCYTGQTNATLRSREVQGALAEVGSFERHRLVDAARETARDALRVASGDPRLLAALLRIG